MVNHPSHYNQGKYEAIDVIEDWYKWWIEDEGIDYSDSFLEDD